jgi:hypothetical protein
MRQLRVLSPGLGTASRSSTFRGGQDALTCANQDFSKMAKNNKNLFPPVSDASCRRRFGSGEVSSENYPMVVVPSERTEAPQTRIQARSSPAEPAKLVSLQIWPPD